MGLFKLKSIVTLSITGAAVYLWVTQQPVPAELLAATGLAWGSLFGGKEQKRFI